MAIKIGHAAGDEQRRASGGAAGDQTGGEVTLSRWYSSPWDRVLRFKDPAKAEKAAKAMEAACANNKIGYDQSQRNTLNEKAKAVGYDLSKVADACECDCSSLVSVCTQAAGVALPYVWGNAPYTGNMEAQFTKTGEFEVLTESKYLTTDAYLKRGDILLNTRSHTAMVLENGSKAGGTAGTPDAPPVGRDDPGAPSIAPVTMNTPLPLLKRGSKGQAVWAMQTLLTDRGYSTQGVDSDFGPNTNEALKKFQAAKGLEADGECGAKSWAALICEG